MKKTMNTLIKVIFAISTFILIAFGLVCLNASSVLAASADTIQYYSDEQYTDSDYLLLPNGTESLSKKITHFSNEVKAASNGTAFSELAQVIPRQYLEATEINATYQYYGNEYGFYMVKEGNYFDLLLIDFVYEFENNQQHSDLEYKIRIKPILQQSFLRVTTSDGSYSWQKYNGEDGARYTYYVSTPRFLSTLQNENALNYGDAGYSKQNDEGVIILQNRVNYGKISYATEGDLALLIGEFAANQVFDYIFDALDKVTFNIAGYIKDYVELGIDCFNAGKETTIIADNEKNIHTEYSKTAQRNNTSIAGYSRVAGIMPKEEVILSAADDSYAESIIVLSDSNYKSRLTQYCEFDIVKRMGIYSSMTLVTSPDDNTSPKFYKQRTLFDNGAENELQIDKATDVYCLPYGTDNFNFRAQYSSDYELNINLTEEADVIVNGNNYHGKDLVIKQYAPSEENINISVSGNSAGVKGTITLSPNTSKTASKINSNKCYLMKTDLSGVLQLKTSDSQVVIKSIYTLENEFLQTYNQYGNLNESDVMSYPFLNDSYYVLLRNNGSQAKSNCSLSVGQVDTLFLEANNSVVLRFENLNYFKINSANSGDYVLSLSNVSGDEYSFQFLNSDVTQLNGIQFRNEFYIIAMGSNKSYYIGIKTGSYESQANIIIRNTDTSFQWKISGAEFGSTGFLISERVQEVKRGNTYSLSFYINGKETDAALFFEDTNTSWGSYGIYFNANNNQITIPSDCPIGGNGVTIKAWSSQEINSSYNHTLKLIPTEEIELNSVEVTNSEDITLKISAPRFVYKIDYNISIPGSQILNKVINISSTEAGNASNYREVNITESVESLTNKSALATITITKIYYYDALKYERDDSVYTYSTSCNNFYASGSGTSNSPYVIRYYRHLNNIRRNASSYFILMNDIDCADKWIPVEDFSGTLNLNSHTIKYNKTLAVTSERYGFIHNNNGNIKNGTFNINITGISNNANYYVGGICISNKGTIENCTVKGNGTGSSYNQSNKNVAVHLSSSFVRYGGIACDNFGTINNCNNEASIGGDISTCGGIVGYFAAGKIYGCYNKTNLYYEQISNGASYFGGIVGEGYYDSNTGNIIEIDNCTNNGIIEYTMQTEIASNAIVRMAQIAGVAPENAKITNCKLYGSARINYDNDIYTSSPQVKITNDAVAEYTYVASGSCVAEGTLITLVDGTQVPVESLNGSELLLVWNLQTGEFDSAPILFIDSDPEKLYNVINLDFSDGTSVKVISEHAFWDFDLNRYVFLREDAAQYLGHWFNKQLTDSNGNLYWTRVQLTNVTITEEYTTAWSPVTYGHLCYYVNGMLSMPGATEGFINIFDVDGNTMQINQEQYLADIATYGLFTYEEFAEIYPVSETIFEAFGGEYLKVSIGKGLIDYETICNLIERYSVYFE